MNYMEQMSSKAIEQGSLDIYAEWSRIKGDALKEFPKDAIVWMWQIYRRDTQQALHRVIPNPY